MALALTIPSGERDPPQELEGARTIQGCQAESAVEVCRVIGTVTVSTYLWFCYVLVERNDPTKKRVFDEAGAMKFDKAYSGARFESS